MNFLSVLATLITEIGVILSFIVPIYKKINKAIDKLNKVETGEKCQLRSDMLRIYYHNREREQIRQYEYENFIMLYEAYKALKGNSFIDKIYEEVHSWEIIS